MLIFWNQEEKWKMASAMDLEVNVYKGRRNQEYRQNLSDGSGAASPQLEV